MQINLIYDSSVESAPGGFETAVAAAAQYLNSLIINPITVNIQVGYGEIGGAPLGGTSSEGGPATGVDVTYAQLRGYLVANVSSPDDATAVSRLPAADPTGGGSFLISAAQEKAWGLLPANGTEIDGHLGFSSTYPYFNYDPNNRSLAGADDFTGVAEHELTHALGRLTGFPPFAYTPLDLFRYAGPGALQLVGGQPAYFSIDGG